LSGVLVVQIIGLHKGKRIIKVGRTVSNVSPVRNQNVDLESLTYIIRSVISGNEIKINQSCSKLRYWYMIKGVDST